MLKKPVYLDYMATTPVDPRVMEKMVQYLGPDGDFGNPASTTHVYGKIAALAVGEQRAKIAASVHAAPEEIVFTSGATEADNLAIMGAACFYQSKGRHLITMKTEHKAVLDSFKHLETEGFEVTWLTPRADGILDLDVLAEAIRPDTILVSIMHVNNEIGVVQDIAAIGAFLRNKGIIFHVDAAQSAGKLPINLKVLPVDLMSFSAHKNYGPKGVGALYIRSRPRIRLQPQMFGGGHEGGLRSGTLATHQIVGMGEAFELAESLRIEEQEKILTLRQRLWNGIKHLPGIHLNGHPTQRIAGNLNISFEKLEGESLMLAFHELAISSKSACSSASSEPSYVLEALGVDRELARSALRISLGRFTTAEQVQFALETICKQASRLRDISPL